MKNKTANKEKAVVPSALVLQGFELVFYRKTLGLERVSPELGKMRGEYIKDILMPELEKIDEKINSMREAYALKNPAGGFKTKEDGTIDYGDQEVVVRNEFFKIIGEDVMLPLIDKAQFLTMRDIFVGTKQEFDEDDTKVFLVVADKLKSLEIRAVHGDQVVTA